MITSHICSSQDPFNYGQICNSEPESSPIENAPFYVCSRTTPFWSTSNRLHFTPSDSNIYIAHLNIIIVQRNGEDPGNWSDNELFRDIISRAIDTLNYYYSNLCIVPIIEYPNCFDTTLGEPDYIPSINIQFTYSIYFIANENYWGSVNPDTSWSSYLNSHDPWRRGINIYYTMDSTTYQLLVEENQLDPNMISYNWVNSMPSETNMERKQYMVLPNKYAEFVYILNNYIPDTAQVISNTVHGYARIWKHELGHIFGLNHSSIPDNQGRRHYTTNECTYSMMHQSSLIACWLPPSEIGQMIRYLHTSNTKRYIDPSTYFPESSYNINDTVSWNYNLRVYSDIIIEDGGVLELTCKLSMPEDASIIVKRGGQLTINGGLVTSYDTVLWQGIQVWGDASASQSTAGAQGKITIVNGGTIENAIIAVRLAKIDGLKYEAGFEGGIIQTNDAHFINNRTGVKFYPYRNMVSGVEMDNLSYFRNSEFLTGAELADESTPEDFLHLNGVKGINISGCSFTNSRPEQEAGMSDRGIGINSYDASFTVSWYCASSYPCEEPVLSTFTNLNYGINARNATTSGAFDVNHSEFNNNLTGIYFNNIDYADIIFNDFELYNVSLFHEPDDIFGGLYIDNCSGYTIEENNFFNDDEYHPQNEIRSIGITVNNSGSDLNMIYRNTFNRLHLGILAQNGNRGTSITTGLKLKCNICTNNEDDFAVTADTSSANMGISIYQGAFILNEISAPAGNLFSHNENSDPYCDFNNTLSSQFIYYIHHDGTNEDPWVPVYYQNIIPCPYIEYEDYEKACPTNFSIGGSNLKSEPNVMNEEELRSRMILMENLRDSAANDLSLWIDAGNTPELNYEVESSTPDESLELYDELIADSPYLSGTVLSSSIEKEEVLVNAMIRDIMVANPHGVKKEELIGALEQRIPPVPDYMMAEIMAGLDSIAQKELRESEIAWYAQERELAFDKLMKIYLCDSNQESAGDSLVALILDHGNINSHYYLATRYLEQNNFTNATLILVDIPEQFELEPGQQAEYQDYQTVFSIITNVLQEGMPLDSIDNTSRQILYQIAENDSRPAIIAQNILKQIDSVDYPEIYILPTSGPITRRYLAEIPDKDSDPEQGNLFRVYPNPGRDYFIIEYSFERVPDQASYSISDQYGRITEQCPIEGKQNQLIRRTTSYSSGLYTIKLIINGNTEKTLKINIIK